MTQTARPTVVNGAPSKSLLLSGLLTFFLGPFGMIYTTVFGTIVMLALSIPLLLLTLGGAWPGIVPICMIWGVWSGHRYNERQRREYAARGGW